MDEKCNAMTHDICDMVAMIISCRMILKQNTLPATPPQRMCKRNHLMMRDIQMRINGKVDESVVCVWMKILTFWFLRCVCVIYLFLFYFIF